MTSPSWSRNQPYLNRVVHNVCLEKINKGFTDEYFN